MGSSPNMRGRPTICGPGGTIPEQLRDLPLPYYTYTIPAGTIPDTRAPTLRLYENTNILYSKGGLYWGDIPEYLHALLLEHYTNTIQKASDQTSDGNMTSSCRNIFG